MLASDAAANHRRKVNWVLTYGASKGYISFQMFKDEGSLEADEVHSTSDGAIVYTYIHLQRRSSRFTVMKCMESMNRTYGVILADVFGYDSVGSNTQSDGALLMKHIAFRMIYEHMKAKNPAFVSCTDGVVGVSRGLLLQYDGFTMIRGLITARCKKLTPFLDNIENELSQAKMDMEHESTRAYLLEEESAAKSIKIEELREIIAKNKAAYASLLEKKRNLEVQLILKDHKIIADQMIQRALANFGPPSM